MKLSIKGKEFKTEEKNFCETKRGHKVAAESDSGTAANTFVNWILNLNKTRRRNKIMFKKTWQLNQLIFLQN